MKQYVVKNDVAKADKKIKGFKKKVKTFWKDHSEAACVFIGACVGSVIVGCMHRAELDKKYEEGYSEGYNKGADEFLDGLYLDAAFNGGRENQIFKNKDGHRLGLIYETLPSKR